MNSLHWLVQYVDPHWLSCSITGRTRLPSKFTFVELSWTKIEWLCRKMLLGNGSKLLFFVLASMLSGIALLTWIQEVSFTLIFRFNPLNTDKLRINATFRQQIAFFWPFSSQFRANPQEKCFLAWTVTVSFGLRTFSSIFSWGMRRIPNFVHEKLHRLRLFEI